MPTSLKELVAAANDSVPKITSDEARRLINKENALLVDVRDGTEVAASGKLERAKNVSRGMLEFKADATSPAHDPELDPRRPVILYCASGGRSALSGKTLRDLGFGRVFNLGGFKDASDAGFPVEPG